jgi:hypothetical protein
MKRYYEVQEDSKLSMGWFNILELLNNTLFSAHTFDSSRGQTVRRIMWLTENEGLSQKSRYHGSQFHCCATLYMLHSVAWIIN